VSPIEGPREAIERQSGRQSWLSRGSPGQDRPPAI